MIVSLLVAGRPPGMAGAACPRGRPPDRAGRALSVTISAIKNFKESISRTPLPGIRILENESRYNENFKDSISGIPLSKEFESLKRILEHSKMKRYFSGCVISTTRLSRIRILGP
jgi:hypothetical protein